ncbi:MAG: response regulator [Acidobacteria bacterium]|nr:MAG: response regulator [Acidobacteriota bacterium]
MLESILLGDQMAENHFVILCVDDEPAVLRPLEIMLQRRGFRVVVANDGASAIELSRQIKFHAVVLDYSMPDMSGGEVARVLREENPSIPIILHTGYKEIHDPLLANVTCTIPKGSLSFLLTKLNDLLHLPEGEQVEAEMPAEAESAHVA